MNHFHTYFKTDCLADGTFAERGLSLSMYLEMSEQLNSHLTFHHTYEEEHIFPVLATKMQQFSVETDGEHLASHKGIHEGLEALAALVEKFKKEPSMYSPTEMRVCLDGFREVLFRHLDAEVNDLRGENLKKYWTLEELESRIPM
ncbi:hypothetical protein DFH07DRAFT_905700 [Mycena maculata]|uniref:Hemerythrin-like domain-containing protein n=1 Tax=Mycena maculata TaxID=230809 RepID=A0AAD7IAU6_9AGAR|nr:hypothetical protein DFH07DRAFT_905700 [Mycena maculata]